MAVASGRTSWEGQGQAPPTPRTTGASDWWPGACLREHGPLLSQSPIGPGQPLEGVGPSGPTKTPGLQGQGPLHRVPLPWRETVITKPDHTHIPATNPGDTCCPLGSQKRPDLHVYKLPPPLLPLTSPDSHQHFLGSARPRSSSTAHLWTLASLGVTKPVSPTWAHPAALPTSNPQGPEAPLTCLPHPPGSADSCSGWSVSWPHPRTVASLPSAVGAPPPSSRHPPHHRSLGAPRLGVGHPAQQQDWGAEGAGGGSRPAGAVNSSSAQQGQRARGSALE